MMVTCSVCAAGPVHINCMQPPLDNVPRKYTCPKCEHTSQGEAGLYSCCAAAQRKAGRT